MFSINIYNIYAKHMHLVKIFRKAVEVEKGWG